MGMKKSPFSFQPAASTGAETTVPLCPIHIPGPQDGGFIKPLSFGVRCYTTIFSEAQALACHGCQFLTTLPARDYLLHQTYDKLPNSPHLCGGLHTTPPGLHLAFFHLTLDLGDGSRCVLFNTVVGSHI